MARRRQAVLEDAARTQIRIARPRIGPGAALAVGLAGGPAAFAAGVGGHLDGPKVAARTVDRVFAVAAARLDDAGAADPGRGVPRLDPGRHLVLEPAHRRPVGGGVVEAPGPAAGLAVAPPRADGGIAGANRKIHVVVAAPVKPHLRRRRCRKTERHGDQDSQRKEEPHHR